ncbi:MAG: hypothetical protein ACR2NB_07530 [Solirubrobacteraceae bacterium]
MTRARSECLLAHAARVQAAACSDPPEPREPAAHEPDWAAEAAERAARLAAQEVDVERSARALADLPRRRGTSTGRPKR